MRSRLGKVPYTIRNYRRSVQVAVLLLLVLSPFLRIFRFDLPTASLYLFGMRLWVRHLFLFSLLTTAGIYIVVTASLIFGRVFCGWVCPQNLFNELARTWDRRFGRSGAVAVSAAVGLLGGFVVWSCFTDGIALLQRYAAGEVPVGPTAFIVGVGLFFTAALSWWRTGVCQVACPYGHLQSIIATQKTMHLEVFNLPGNRDICAACGLCLETCHMGVDPRTMNQKDCVACGDCLDACRHVSDARRLPRVLNFALNEGVTPRLLLPAVLAAGLLSATAYGLATRPLVEVTVAKDHRTVMAAGGSTSGGALMRVTVINLGGAAETYRLQVEGLPPGWAAFERQAVTLEPGHQADVALRVVPGEFRPGLYPFDVLVTGLSSGAGDRFRSVHVVGG